MIHAPNPLAPADHALVIQREGVALACTDTGHETPPVVLIHGLCDSRQVMAPLARRLADRHRTVTTDLRGHGASDAPHGDYSVETLAADVAHVCDTLGATEAVIVGHSLGGAIAVQLSASRPDLVAAVVLLEGALLFREEVVAAAAPVFEAVRTPGWRDAMHAFIDSGFIETDDPALRARAHAELDHLQQHAVAGTVEAAGRWDAEPALRACRVPLLHIDAGSNLADLERLAQLCPQLEVGHTVGVGHNQMLATPDQVAAMIARFIAVRVAT